MGCQSNDVGSADGVLRVSFALTPSLHMPSKLSCAYLQSRAQSSMASVASAYAQSVNAGSHLRPIRTHPMFPTLARLLTIRRAAELGGDLGSVTGALAGVRDWLCGAGVCLVCGLSCRLAACLTPAGRRVSFAAASPAPQLGRHSAAFRAVARRTATCLPIRPTRPTRSRRTAMGASPSASGDEGAGVAVCALAVCICVAPQHRCSAQQGMHVGGIGAVRRGTSRVLASGRRPRRSRGQGGGDGTTEMQGPAFGV